MGEKMSALKYSISEYEKKHSQYEKLKEKYQILQEKEDSKKQLNQERRDNLNLFSSMLGTLSFEITKFEEDLKNIHNFIAGNKNCQFELKIKDTGKEFIQFDYRIKLDGSSGINRIKTFIYDVLLMLNESTSKKHLGFLIHDNIFASAGKDDMVKSLNYLYQQSLKGKKFQYILTINKDEFESVASQFDFNASDLKRATFTREKPFLQQVYKEQ